MQILLIIKPKTHGIWRFSYFSEDHTDSKWLNRYSGFMSNVLPRTLLKAVFCTEQMFKIISNDLMKKKSLS